MTQGDSFYLHLKALPIDAVVCIVRMTYPNAMSVCAETNNAFSGKTVVWHIVEPDYRTTYSPTIITSERDAWLAALQRICREKWPNEY